MNEFNRLDGKLPNEILLLIRQYSSPCFMKPYHAIIIHNLTCLPIKWDPIKILNIIRYWKVANLRYNF